MTLQNLSKILDKYEQQYDSGSIQQFALLKGLPFYDWSLSNQRDFNHAIGLPQKNGQPMPLFDYEQLLYDTLQTNRHVWIKKATGLGVTEFMLRYMTWLCVKDDSLRGAQMCIVTGPRIELAVTLIDRLKRLFTAAEKQPFSLITFDTKETVAEGYSLMKFAMCFLWRGFLHRFRLQDIGLVCLKSTVALEEKGERMRSDVIAILG